MFMDMAFGTSFQVRTFQEGAAVARAAPMLVIVGSLGEWWSGRTVWIADDDPRRRCH
jgi:hypothetical protein